jgi:Lrp/AsnC family leucine-responsive transcriptional regulator
MEWMIMPKHDFDAIDRRLLDALQGEARLTNVELADRAGLSASPCLRRVKILEREGVIQGYRAVLDRRKLGLALTVFVGLKIERHRDEEATAFQQAMRAVPEVIACHLISGEHDFLLEVVVADLEAYEEFLLGTLLKLPGVSDVRSNFAIRMVKPPGPLPLEHLPG